MSHYHLEIIMPPVADIKAAVEQIMKPFSENEEGSRNSFWDWWVIGGRYAGAKLNYDKSKEEAFYAWLKEEGVTVSGLQFGKQELSPNTQAPKVDAKWAEMFPESGLAVCPLFSHYQDQYKDNLQAPDVLRLGNVAKDLTAFAVIVAKKAYNSDDLEAEFMIHQYVWNGVMHVDTKWDGLVSSALEMQAKKLENYREEYRKEVTPTDEWLCVTVDYHS